MSTVFLDDTPLQLANGVTGAPWQVETANPANFFQLISRTGECPPAMIYAQTFMPPGTVNPPAVIVVPGSLGVAPSHLYKAELLTGAGFAACIIDPFGQRGVESTVSNQAQYSFAASAWDVIATARQLSARGGINNNAIGAQGHSRGGSAVINAACLPALMGTDNPLAAVYGAYPWCGQQFLNPDAGRTRVRAVIGDQDEWCLPQQVQGYIQALRLSGAEATWRIFAGAHHSFDRDTPVEDVPEASVAPGAPTIYISDNGAMMHPASGEIDPAFTERELMVYGIKAGYGVHGARIGTADGFADAFHEDMMAFWQDSLLQK